MSNSFRLPWHKLTHWEYWPMEVVYFPVFFYWLYLSVRARSLFFFSASNPGIETGGMLGEVKFDILKKIPEAYRTPTLFFAYPFEAEQVLDQLKKNSWTYPLIFKPDIGERGNGVEKIDNAEQALDYLSHCTYDLLVQPFITYPIELGVFYYRYPSREKGQVVSVVAKEFLKVKGNGSVTLAQLVDANPRAALQAERLSIKYAKRWQEVMDKDHELLLEPIGNHCRGTSFRNANDIINEQLVSVFDTLSKQIDGFYFGRFDLKCRSIEELMKGEGISIMELNGAGSEQGHIYHPGFSFFTAVKTILQQWRILFEISVENHKRGIPYMTLKETRGYLRKSKQLRQKYSA
ncbi:MAG: hypothetical protein JWM14_39 [Chitinophagaceae bacterium]|nr:hypothetical protein [Chitinophagaceae bacterium]